MHWLIHFKFRVFAAIFAVTLIGSSHAQFTVTGFHAPITVAAATPRPCLFIRLSDGVYYTVKKTAEHYSEIRQLAIVAFTLKTPVYIYLTGNLACGAPEIDSIYYA